MSWVARTLNCCRIVFAAASLAIWPLVFIFTFNISYFSRLPQTVFAFDYQARQQVLRNIYAYPNVLLARIFQNKAQIPIGKFEHNLTALIDPNNYFFGFHPREIVSGNKNAVKFPFAAIPIFLLGFISLGSRRFSKTFFISLISLLFFLSLFANFDKYDFLLYFPLGFIFLLGVKKTPPVYFLFTLPLVLVELLRQFIIFYP